MYFDLDFALLIIREILVNPLFFIQINLLNLLVLYLTFGIFHYQYHQLN